jgi:hypothetical protein
LKAGDEIMNAQLKHLSDDQLEFLHENNELFDALYELAASEKFQALFGDMSLGEVIDSQEYTLADENSYSNADLRQRYEEYQKHKDDPGFVIRDDEDFSKLEAKYRK